MKQIYLRLLSTFAFVIVSNASFSQSGIYESYVVINTGSGNELYDLHSPTDSTSDVPTFDFNNSFLGVFGTQNGTLILNGGQNNIYKCPNTDVTSGFLNYRVYPSGSPSGAFTGISLNSSVSTSSGAICSGGFNQMWVTDNFNLNLLNGLTSGDYTLEVYTLADHTNFGVPQTPHFVNNNGNNFTATFRADNPPVANCQNITIQLDASGNASISDNDIDNGSSDDFGISSIVASQTSFTCANLGTNNITLTVTDTLGQTDTCVAIVTVEDSVLNATASITSDLGTEICEGDTMTFTATGSDLGLNPQYEWFVNTVSVGNNSDTYATSALNDGDSVYVEITSISCSGALVTTSNSMTISVFVPPTADAGVDRIMCNNGTLELMGTFGGSATSGSWSSASGGFVGNTYYPSISNGTVIVYFTTDDPPGPCGPAVDSMLIRVYPFRDAIASNLTTITDCNDTTIQLSGNRTGQWSAVSVPSGSTFSFSNVNDPNATFTGESGVTYEITWTTDQVNPICFDEDIITVSFPSCADVIDFDGADDFINFEDNNNLSSNFSIEAWIKPNVVNGNIKTVLSKRDAEDLTTGYDLRHVNNTISFNVNNTYSISASGINTSRWYHVAVTYDGTQYALYIDGILQSSSIGPAPTLNTHNMMLGAMNSSADLTTNHYNGWLDEVRIWNTTLTAEQIREMMNQEIEDNISVRGSVLGLDVPGLNWSDLAAYYQMNQGTADINAGFLVGDVGVSGRLSNITSLQDESAPLPYMSNNNNNWNNAATWLNGNVQMIPNTNSVDWNIVRINHDVNSGNRATILLGLLVDSNRYTITNDQSLRITKYLKIDGTLDLEGEAQLLQDTGSIVDYSGIGKLEIQQQGTTNLYAYNYWGSPVGTNGSSYILGNTLHDTATGINPLALQWTTAHDANSSTTPITLSSRWLYLYENYIENSYASWNPIDENSSIAVGLGFTMKGSGNSGSLQDYTFIGQPNNGIISSPVAGGNQALLGNPYPSALDAHAFILDNSTVLLDGALQFWEHSPGNASHVLSEYEGGYAYLNLTSGVPAVSPPEINGIGTAGKIPEQYVPIAQGFFVTGNATGGNITFNNNQRAFVKESGGNSVFMRTLTDSNTIGDSIDNESEVDNKFVRINFISPENATRHLLIGFMDNNVATDAADYGYDALNGDSFPSDMSFSIEGKEYIIQGVGSFDNTKSYPLHITLENGGEFKIELAALENFVDNIDVFIYDASEDSYSRINETSYIKTLDAGEYSNRFFLAFREDSTLSSVAIETNELSINYIQSAKEILITSTNHLQIKALSLLNIMGQRVLFWPDLNVASGGELRIPVSNIAQGNYILNLRTNDSVVNKKVIVGY